jgi:uridine kinase
MTTTKPMVVAIASVSGGGKTAITRELQHRMQHADALYFDDEDYDVTSGIVDICQWVEDGADYDLWNLQTFAQRIQVLLSDTERSVDFVFLDYPFAFKQKQIGILIDYAIFIDTPLDIAMARRVLRDFSQTITRNICEDMKGYLSRGRNAFLHMVDTIKPDSDFVVDGSLPVTAIVDLICMKLDEVKRDRTVSQQ